MAGASTGSLHRSLETLWNDGTVAGLTDAQLLERFAARRDSAAEVAFQALVTRHGPLVWKVCRQFLRAPHDVEDAFQATFLILIRKAGSIRVGDSLGPWLYAVAYRVAVRSRLSSSRHRSLEMTRDAPETAAPG